ncbi:MAG TPA: hypothetical protein VLC08_01735 [Chitinolyticbacter sp.]|nr:hypothetical protein [Chitinolyticbacter sp.]
MKKYLVSAALVLTGLSASASAATEVRTFYGWLNNMSPITFCDQKWPGSNVVGASVAGQWVQCSKTTAPAPTPTPVPPAPQTQTFYGWLNNMSPITFCDQKWPGSQVVDASVAGKWVKCRK